MKLVTLLTDFGLKDGNVGVMKGVILGMAPDTHIVDLSHQISPQDVREGALILARSVPYFPAGTIHVAVVDPGVGTARRPIAAQIGAQRFVLPDNGLLTLLLERAEGQVESGEPARVEIVHLDRPRYWLPQVSQVFHGRDIFAPVAGHWVSGVPLHELGTPVYDPVRLEFPRPQPTPTGWRGEVIHIDHFGNLSTNIRYEHLGEAPVARVRICGVEIAGMIRTFGERSPGDLVALYGSTGNLIICQVNGSAARQLGAVVGEPVEVILTAVQSTKITARD